MIIEKELLFKIIAYDENTHTCKAMATHGNIFVCDPFVGCAYPQGENSKDIVGKSFLVKNQHWHNGSLLPLENDFQEMQIQEANNKQ